MYGRIVFSAGAAGLLAGILPSAARQLQAVPVILKAETYQGADAGVAGIVATAIENAVFRLAPGTGCATAFRKLA